MASSSKDSVARASALLCYVGGIMCSFLHVVALMSESGSLARCAFGRCKGGGSGTRARPALDGKPSRPLCTPISTREGQGPFPCLAARPGVTVVTIVSVTLSYSEPQFAIAWGEPLRLQG
jgi:hypothetical protein